MRQLRFFVLMLGLAACDGKGDPESVDELVPPTEPESGASDPATDPEEVVTPPVRRTPDGVPVRGPRQGPGAPAEGGTGEDDTVRTPVPRVAPGAPGAPTRTAPKPIGPMPQGIVQVSGNRWTVTRSLVDRWKKSTGMVGLVKDAGEGWSVAGVRTRAAYHLGMRNGDVIMEVNGHKLDTRTQLLGAYLDLKNDTEFDVVFYRNGARKVHHYSIVN